MREPLEEESGPPHAHHWKVSQAKNTIKNYSPTEIQQRDSGH